MAPVRSTWIRSGIRGTLPRMTPTRAYLTSAGLLALGAALALTGCPDETALPGEPGGPCKLGDPPCVDGYDCIGGVCAASEPDAGVTTYRAEIEFDQETVDAIAGTEVDFFFTVRRTTPDGETAAYDPETDGALFITVVPSEAGEVRPARPVLLDGLGTATFRPCDRAQAPDCPDSAVIRVARDAAPLESIGDSELFLLVDPRPPPMPDGGTDPDAGAQ